MSRTQSHSLRFPFFQCLQFQPKIPSRNSMYPKHIFTDYHENYDKSLVLKTQWTEQANDRIPLPTFQCTSFGFSTIYSHQNPSSEHFYHLEKKKKEKKRPQLFSFQLVTLFPRGINERLTIFPRTSICHQISTNGLINFSTLPHKATTPHNFSVRSNEGLTLEMPIFHGGNSTFITFDATQLLKFSGLSRCCLSNDNKMRWSNSFIPLRKCISNTSCYIITYGLIIDPQRPAGPIAQLVEHCTGIVGVRVRIPVQAWSFRCLSCDIKMQRSNSFIDSCVVLPIILTSASVRYPPWNSDCAVMHSFWIKSNRNLLVIDAARGQRVQNYRIQNFEFKITKLYSNVASLLWRVDRGVPALFRKIDINRSAVDIYRIVYHWVSELQICIFWLLTIVVSRLRVPTTQRHLSWARRSGKAVIWIH